MAIVDFEPMNLGADSSLGGVLADLVRRDGDLCDAFDVVGTDELRQCLAETGWIIRGAGDERNCTLLASRVRADLVVAGTLLRYGSTVRLDLTLFEDASGNMFKCRDFFVDDRSPPDATAGHHIARRILAAGPEDRRSVTLIVDEAFHEQELEQTRWQTKCEQIQERVASEQRYGLTVEDGSLRLEAAAVSNLGWSSVLFVRAQSTTDLRDEHDYVIDVTLSAQSPHGDVTIKLAEDIADTDRDESLSAILFRGTGSRDQRLKLDNLRVRIEIAGAAQSATVYTDAGEPGQPETVDLTSLKNHWKLRFTAYAGASAGAPRASAALTIHEVRIVRVTRGASVWGRTINRETLHDVAEAKVRVKDLDWEVRSDPAGLFDIPCPPGQWTVDATATGYLSNGLSGVTVAAEAGMEIEIPLERATLGYGDVDKVFPLSAMPGHCPDERATGTLASDGRQLFFTLLKKDRPAQSRIVSMSFDGMQVAPVNTLHLSGSLAFVEGTLYVSAAFPASIYHALPDSTLDRLDDFWDVFGIGDMAYDGRHVWCVATDGHRDLHLLVVCDPATKKKVRHIETGDPEIQGIACDGRRLWVSSGSDGGKVHEIDKDKVWGNMYLKPGILRSFPGQYTSLVFADGYLWGFDQRRQQICRIWIDAEPE